MDKEHLETIVDEHNFFRAENVIPQPQFCSFVLDVK